MRRERHGNGVRDGEYNSAYCRFLLSGRDDGPWHHKMRYPTRREAQKAKRKMVRVTHGKSKFNVFQCDFCHGWHLGRVAQPKGSV